MKSYDSTSAVDVEPLSLVYRNRKLDGQAPFKYLEINYTFRYVNEIDNAVVKEGDKVFVS